MVTHLACCDPALRRFIALARHLMEHTARVRRESAWRLAELAKIRRSHGDALDRLYAERIAGRRMS
jgi:hypothetical protein